MIAGVEACVSRSSLFVNRARSPARKDKALSKAPSDGIWTGLKRSSSPCSVRVEGLRYDATGSSVQTVPPRFESRLDERPAPRLTELGVNPNMSEMYASDSASEGEKDEEEDEERKRLTSDSSSVVSGGKSVVAYVKGEAEGVCAEEAGESESDEDTPGALGRCSWVKARKMVENAPRSAGSGVTVSTWIGIGRESYVPSEVAVKSLAIVEEVEKGEKGTGVDAVLLVSDGANRDIVKERTETSRCAEVAEGTVVMLS